MKAKSPSMHLSEFIKPFVGDSDEIWWLVNKLSASYYARIWISVSSPEFSWGYLSYAANLYATYELFDYASCKLMSSFSAYARLNTTFLLLLLLLCFNVALLTRTENSWPSCKFPFGGSSASDKSASASEELRSSSSVSTTFLADLKSAGSVSCTLIFGYPFYSDFILVLMLH